MAVMQLVRTHKKVSFLTVSIGQPFWAHNSVWIRTDYAAATELQSTTRRAEGILHITNVCNYLIDKEDEWVEAIEVRVVDPRRDR